MPGTEREIAALERLTVDQLRGKYHETFGEPTAGRNKQWLIKRIAWRIQANAEGGLSERALRRAQELANDADLRLTAPRPARAGTRAPGRPSEQSPGPRRSAALRPGDCLQRTYKGQSIEVQVLADGFEWLGERYGSLTAVAKAVTGKHWNGYHFFGLRKSGGQR